MPAIRLRAFIYNCTNRQNLLFYIHTQMLVTLDIWFLHCFGWHLNLIVMFYLMIILVSVLVLVIHPNQINYWMPRPYGMNFTSAWQLRQIKSFYMDKALDPFPPFILDQSFVLPELFYILHLYQEYEFIAKNVTKYVSVSVHSPILIVYI